MGFSLVMASRGSSLVAVCRLPVAAVSLVAELGLGVHRLQYLQRTGLVALRLWDLPRPGIEPLSPTLAGGLSTTEPPGKPQTRVS